MKVPSGLVDLSDPEVQSDRFRERPWVPEFQEPQDCRVFPVAPLGRVDLSVLSVRLTLMARAHQVFRQVLSVRLDPAIRFPLDLSVQVVL